jgi:ribonuclease P protein component
MTAVPAQGYDLPRQMRLQERRDFHRLKLQGNRLVMGCLIANWNLLPAGRRPQLGVVTSRQLGSAVVRSRARRLLRETFRLHQHDLREPVALVLIGRKSIVGRKLAGVERDFLRFLQQARLMKARS